MCRSCSLANTLISPSRIMVPSSFMISQITPAGVSPANTDKSTLASVWPRRSSTPPSRARKGNICPGIAMSVGVVSGAISVLTVTARSSAEIPVVTPCTASTDNVKPVPKPLRFCACGTIIGICSRSSKLPRMARQTRPRPWVTIKLIAAGVAKSAATTRSPSFSRSSSSTTITMRPCAYAFNAASTSDRSNLLITILFQHVGVDT